MRAGDQNSEETFTSSGDLVQRTLEMLALKTLSAETERWANQTAAIARILEAKAGA